jgi:CDP-glucose 4,6-dehydratase
VLEPLGGYLWLGANLLEKNDLVAGEAFNFGPDPRINRTVGQLLSALAVHWPGADWEAVEQGHGAKKESNLLKLCCDKALQLLDWYAALTIEETVALTADWYRAYYQYPSGDMIEYTKGQIDEYTRKARERGLTWTR